MNPRWLLLTLLFALMPATLQAEDAGICEAVQRGMASGSWTPGRLNPDEERGVWHFHELLRAAWRETGG